MRYTILSGIFEMEYCKIHPEESRHNFCKECVKELGYEIGLQHALETIHNFPKQVGRNKFIDAIYMALQNKFQ